MNAITAILASSVIKWCVGLTAKTATDADADADGDGDGELERWLWPKWHRLAYSRALGAPGSCHRRSSPEAAC